MKWLREVVRLAAGFCAIGLLSAGCGVSVRELAGFPAQSDPSVTLRATEPKWLLIKNPRFGDVASEPEYVWVEEDKVPSTLKTLVFGKSSEVMVKRIGSRVFVSPGPLGLAGGGLGVLDDGAGGLKIEVRDASGAVTAEEMVGGGPLLPGVKMRVQGGGG